MKGKSIFTLILITVLVLLTFSCQAKTSATNKTKTQPKPKPQVTFVELGSVNCIPCKMMKPVMTAIEKEYGDKISVVFHDVNKDRQWASTFNIRVIPTQVFLDKKGREFYRHEGFFPKEEIMKLVDKQLGIKRTTDKK